MTEAAKAMMSMIPEDIKEEIYRSVLAEYTKEDMIGRYCETQDIDEDDITEETMENIEDAAAAYAYNGDYDCNLCYWDNIDCLLGEYVHA